MALSRIGANVGEVESDVRIIALPLFGYRRCLFEHLDQRVEDRLLRLRRELIPKIPKRNLRRIRFRQRGGESLRCMSCIRALVLLAESTLLNAAEPLHQQ